MLYDKKMEAQKSIIIKQKNGTCYTMFASSIGGYDACVLSRHDLALALADNRGTFLSNTPVDIAICENVTIRNGCVVVLGLQIMEHVNKRKRMSDGMYFINLDEVDVKLNYVAGEVIIDDIEYINADSKYFIALLNMGLISIDSEAMKSYDLTPRWILCSNNVKNPKKYIK